MTWTSKGKAVFDEEQGDDKAKKKVAKYSACPHCGGEIVVHFSTEITDIATPNPDDWKNGLSPEQLTLIDLAKQSGIMQSFKAVAEYVWSHQLPNNLDKYFITFMKTAVQRIVPPHVVEHYARTFPATQVSFFMAQRIAAVLSNGAIVCFAPQDILCGQLVRKANGNGGGMRLKADPAALDWISTRFGYVAGKGVMFDALKAKSLGEMARPGL